MYYSIEKIPRTHISEEIAPETCIENSIDDIHTKSAESDILTSKYIDTCLVRLYICDTNIKRSICKYVCIFLLQI